MSSLEKTNFDEAEDLGGEVLAFPIHYELATEENINNLGYTLKMRVPDYGEPLADPEKEVKRQEGRFIPADWKPLGFVHSQAGLLIKAAEFTGDKRSLETKYSKPYALFSPDSLSELRGLDLGNGQIGVAFRYYKQIQGEELEERIIMPSGFAYGIHAGHLGIPEENIPPEPAGWYIVGDQVEMQDGQVISTGERTFPLSRIIDGPIGDPRDPKHREIFGIY